MIFGQDDGRPVTGLWLLVSGCWPLVLAYGF